MINHPNRSMKSDNIDELKERADLLSTISKYEEEAQWTDIGELRERADLLAAISRHEDDDVMTDTKGKAHRAVRYLETRIIPSHDPSQARLSFRQQLHSQSSAPDPRPPPRPSAIPGRPKPRF